MQQINYLLMQAWQNIKSKPAFTINVVITLSLTVGALICALTLMYLMLFKPLPYPQQETLFTVENTKFNDNGEQVSRGFSYLGIEYFYKHQNAFEQAALVYHIADVLSSLKHQPTGNSAYVTPEWFDLLAIPLHKGRGLLDSENIDNHNPVAVISFDTWINEFAQSKDVLEKTITIRGVNYRIVGVTAKEFIEPEISEIGRKTAVWLPWDFNWTAQMKWGTWQIVDEAVQLLVKVKKTESTMQLIQQINLHMNDIWQQQAGDLAVAKNWQVELNLKPLVQAIFGEQKSLILYIFLGCMGIFVIAMANIANLFMSRTIEQRRRLSIIAAMGANKKQLAKILFSESSLLMLLSLPFTLMISQLGFSIMQQYLVDVMPRASELNISLFSVSLAILVLFILSLLFTFVCSSIIQYRELRATLNSSGKGTGVQIKKKIRLGLIVSQVTVATVLVFININLFKMSLTKINTPMEINVTDGYQLRLSAKTPTKKNRLVIKQEMQEIKKILSESPAIDEVSVSLSPLIWFGSFPVTLPATNEEYTTQAKFIDESYFDLLEQPMLQGDNFSHQQVIDGERVVIINDAFAAALKPDGNVIGEQLNYFGGEHTIIGVVKGLKSPADGTIPYRRYTPDRGGRANFMIKVKAGQQLTELEVHTLVKKVTTQYSVFSFKALTEDRTRLLFTQYTTLAITALLTVLTIFLASVGLYGVLSYSTQMRRFEIGTRLAIGAKGRDIVSLIFKDNASALLGGIVLGIVILVMSFFIFKERLIHYLNVDLIPLFILTLTVILLISFFSCYLPLRQYIKKPAIHSLRGSE
jgi:predicted permease